MNQPNNDPNSQEKKFSAEELDRIMAESGGGSPEPQPAAESNRAESTSSRFDNQDRNQSENSSQPQSSAEPQERDPRGKHTSLQCLALVARHHGIDVSADRLIHDYSLEFDEPSLKRVLRIGKDTGLKIRHSRLTWKQLCKLDQAFPVMIRLENGNYVIAVGMRESDEAGDTVKQIAVFDPLAGDEGFIFLSQEKFEKSWKGEVILAKKKTSLLKQNQKFSLRWFIPEVIREWRSFFNVGLAAIFIHLIALVVPLYFQIVIDKVLVNYAQATLQVLTVGICIALIFDAILGYLRSYLLLYATSKIDVRVATRTFGHLMRLPLNFFEHITAGVLTKHMQQTSQIREFLTGSLFLTLLDSTALIIFIPILLYYSVPLTIVVLIFAALLGVNIGVLLIPYRTRLEALYHAEGERQAMLVETIHGIQTVKALSMEPVQRKHWDDSSAQAVAMHFRVGKISIAATTISKLLEKLLTVTVVWFGASLVLGKELSVGELVAFQMISGRVTGPLVQLVSLVHSYQQCALSVRMLGTVMNRDEEPGIGRGLRPMIDGEMQFEGVTFRYDPTAAPALEDVSFDIPRGKITGIVGRSGSGKTTLTRMIQGMHQPQSGIIRIDKLDMRELDISHVRQNIGVVLQDNFLFRGSIRDNIAMAKTNASFQEVVYVARLAGAAEFIERMPQSYDTMLEENGSNLSGGQKQRLAIARALLKEPKILIFDEATSALDPESEAIIQRNLKRIAKGRTVVVVSHRLTTLTDCDQIIVMERGRIDMIGTHQQLLQSCKVYQELWYQQTGRG
ncbi:peptidase domain-containing ABC transporter [Mariniblastus fucicola]|uniref:Toxin RTX-I translocation ATP-binding protein n=1 Tax=Mariniblastus fucicola TaxID=980251 RepID=A0A5B9PE30_9BACT|nr:peptidase domain-containing ABC transporter [Mariniblastus fucicola]QEG23455.1 Toxin RTX-I translocation ATP-binding protein [Mariniblastus fucicola]